MTALKICGLQPGDDLTFTAKPEVTHVGFIEVRASRRYVAPEAVAQMAKEVDASCRKVGVYVDEEFERLVSCAHTAQFDVIQLHGNESPELCAKLRTFDFEVWKAISVDSAEGAGEELMKTLERYAPVVDAVLLDTAPPKGARKGVTGGHGVKFDWSTLRGLRERLEQAEGPMRNLKIWVAGGIRPDNATALLREFFPYGLDVSSGVEVNGRKSLNQITAMREAVREYANCSATTR